MSNGAIAQAVSRTRELPPLFVDDVSELQYDFPVKNETDQPVQFTKLIQGCACMGASRIDTMFLAPREETILHFQVDLRQRKGHQRIVCRLIEAGGSEWSYEIGTTLYKRAAFTENGTLHFGMVDPNCEEVRDTVLILRAENVDSLPPQVSFRTDSTYLRVEAGEPTTETLPDQIVERKIPLKFHLRTPETPGLGQAAIFAEFARNGVKQEEQTGISWNVRSFYTVEPQQAFFGTVDSSSTKRIDKSVLIRRKDGGELKIKAVKLSSTVIRYSIEPTEKSSAWRIVLSLDPKSMNESVWDEVVIETDYQVQPWVKFPVAAIGVRSN